MRYFWRLWPHQHVPFRTDTKAAHWYCGRCMLGISWMQAAWAWLLVCPHTYYRKGQ